MNNKEQLLTDFQRIDEKYAPKSFHFREYSEKTESELEDEARTALEKYRADELAKIDKFDSKYQSLSEKAAAVLEGHHLKENLMESGLENSLNNLQNRSIKRGLIHSSIHENLASASREKTNEQLLQSQKETAEKLESYAFQKELLLSQKDAALAAFDIAYAVKLEDRIAKLSADMDKQRIAVEKENEKIRSEQEAYMEHYQRESLAGEIALKSGLEKQEALLDFFAQNEASKEAALSELSENQLFYQQQLGIAYYNNTVNKIRNWEG